MDHHPIPTAEGSQVASSALRIAPGTGKWWALGIAFTLAFTVFASWRVLTVSAQAIDVTTTGFKVIDERTLKLTFDVHKPAEVAVVCTVHAQDQKKNVVGSTTVDVPAGTERTTTHAVLIKTTTQAFAGLVHDCVRR